MIIKQALNQAVIMLKNENIDAPKNKARMLLQATLKKSKEYLMIYDTKEITPEERDNYIKNIKRLIAGEPLSSFDVKFALCKYCNFRFMYRKRSNSNISCKIYKKQ